MLSFHRTRINAKHIDGVIKLASFDIVKQFQNLFGKVNLFTASILHLIITPWLVIDVRVVAYILEHPVCSCFADYFFFN